MVVFLGLVLAMGCGYVKRERVPLKQVLEQPMLTPIYEHGGWIIARGSVHNHTTYSDGCRSPEDLVQMARNEGVAILAITDHREGRICGGEICVDVGGVNSKKCGYPRYMDHIKSLAAASEMPMIIPGMEVAPYAWNERDLPWFLIRGSGWHFTVYGIEDPEVYENMPARDQFALRSEDAAGVEPYDEFVNYIRDEGGLVFQAHPESSENEWVGPLHLWTGAPTHLTARLGRLTGVAVIPSGVFIAGKPGGEWDQALVQYIVGMREEPLWAWGETDYHCPPGILSRSGTLFYLDEFTRDSVFEAVRQGRMVAVMGEAFLDSYVAQFSAGEGRAAQGGVILGEEVDLSRPAVIRFSLNKDVTIKEARLIRNGKVIYTTTGSSFEYKDTEGFESGGRCYYRVELMGKDASETQRGSRLFTNPVFVKYR